MGARKGWTISVHPLHWVDQPQMQKLTRLVIPASSTVHINFSPYDFNLESSDPEIFQLKGTRSRAIISSILGTLFPLEPDTKAAIWDYWRGCWRNTIEVSSYMLRAPKLCVLLVYILHHGRLRLQTVWQPKAQRRQRQENKETKKGQTPRTQERLSRPRKRNRGNSVCTPENRSGKTVWGNSTTKGMFRLKALEIDL